MTAAPEVTPAALRRMSEALRQLNRECVDVDCTAAGQMCERCIESIEAMRLLEAAAAQIEALTKGRDELAAECAEMGEESRENTARHNAMGNELFNLRAKLTECAARILDLTAERDDLLAERNRWLTIDLAVVAVDRDNALAQLAAMTSDRAVAEELFVSAARERDAALTQVEVLRKERDFATAALHTVDADREMLRARQAVGDRQGE